MFVISNEQLNVMNRILFCNRLRVFVERRCRNNKLKDWLKVQVPHYTAWSEVWPDVCVLSEHDCALTLIYLAVCDCENVARPALNDLILDINNRSL